MSGLNSLLKTRWVLHGLLGFGLTWSLSIQTAWAADEGRINAAKAEGELSWYTSMDRERGAGAILNKFEEKYPFIKTKLVRTTGENILNRILVEARAGKFLWDVINLTLPEVEHIKSKGYLQKYNSPENKYFPEQHIDPEGYWTDVYDNTIVLAYNKNMGRPEELPKNWEDLTDPRWKGQILLNEEAYEWFAIMLKVMGEEKGVKFMQDFSRNQPQLRRSHNIITMSIAAGEFTLGLTYGHQVEQFKQKGAPIDWIALEPVPVFPHPIANGKNAPHPNVAKLFYDFVISQEGQMLVRAARRIPPRNGVEPDPPRLKKDLKLVPSTPAIAQRYTKYVDRFVENFRQQMPQR